MTLVFVNNDDDDDDSGSNDNNNNNNNNNNNGNDNKPLWSRNIQVDVWQGAINRLMAG